MFFTRVASKKKSQNVPGQSQVIAGQDIDSIQFLTELGIYFNITFGEKGGYYMINKI